jgi:hypothetical protein
MWPWRVSDDDADDDDDDDDDDEYLPEADTTINLFMTTMKWKGAV